MRFRNLLGVVMVSLVFCLTCQTFSNGPEASNPTNDQPNYVLIKPTSAILNESSAQVVDLSKGQINIANEKQAKNHSRPAIERVQFSNAQNGWAATAKVLFKTADGGNTWQRLGLSLAAQSHISSFFFLNESLGWLTVVNTNPEQSGLSSSLITSTRDGGESWTEQTSLSPGVVLNEVHFKDSRNGLAVGGRTVIDKPPYQESFAASTNDGGTTWENISERIKSVARDKYPRPIDDISWSGPTGIFLLLRGGAVLGSSDDRKTWNQTIQFKDERPNGSVSSTGFYKLVFDPRSRIRVLAGAMGEEGYWGDLITSDEHDSWTGYELIRIPIRDAVFLSEREIVASGWEIKAADEKNASSLPAVGIILHSLDGGKSWSPLYRSNMNESFVSLTEVSKNHFYAVSDAGTLIRFSLRKT